MHPTVKQLESLNPPDGSLIIFRVPEAAKKSFIAGTGQALGKWIEQTKRFSTCILLLSDDASVEELHPRSVLEILERQSKETVSKVMEAWKIAHDIAPDDKNLIGLYALQQQMSKVIDASVEIRTHLDPDNTEHQKLAEAYDTQLKALQDLVASVPTQHLAPDAPEAPEAEETPETAIPEECAVCGAPNFRIGPGYSCRNSHSMVDQVRAQRLKDMEKEDS